MSRRLAVRRRLAALAALSPSSTVARAQAPRDMILATAPSTQDTGLLDSLLPVYVANHRPAAATPTRCSCTRPRRSGSTSPRAIWPTAGS